MLQREAPPYRLRKFNALALPKAHQPRCELTGLPAQVECVTPHLTLYYATEEHAEEAWEGIMHKIAPLLGPLRAPQVVVGSQEDRARREYTMATSKRALVELCTQEAAKFLVAGRYELALPGAIQALNFLKEIEGDGSVEMIPPYLQLAETNLGLGRFGQCEEFLSLANWSILKNPDCSNHLRARLHRNFGKLYSAQGKVDLALQELARDIYCSSLEVGPEHVDTAAGYFHAATVFYTQHRIENALAFFDKVVDIWYKFLATVRTDADLAGSLGEAQLREAVDMLEHILNTRVKLLGDGHIATGEAKYTLGLLILFASTNTDAARDMVEAACATYTKHLGPDHPSTRDIRDVLEQMQGAATSSSSLIIIAETGNKMNPAKNPAAVSSAPPSAPQSLSADFQSITSHFPAEMPRATLQSPIPLPPSSKGPPPK